MATDSVATGNVQLPGDRRKASPLTRGRVGGESRPCVQAHVVALVITYRCSQTRPPTAELRRGYVAWALTTLFLRSSAHFNTDPACRTGVLVRRLRAISVPTPLT